MKLLLVARRFNSNFPDVIGGVIVSCENLIDYLDKSRAAYTCVDTNKKSYSNRFISFFCIINKVRKAAPDCDHFALNLNKHEIYLLAPFFIILARLHGKSISLRVFGGDFDVFSRSNVIYRLMTPIIVRNLELVFFETRHIYNLFSDFQNVHQLSNCRPDKSSFQYREYNGRFIFLAQIKTTKGVGVILEALKYLDNIQVDFYGPLIDYSEDDLTSPNSSYKGIASSKEIHNLLSASNFLLFPTFHEGEGYPGTIIESYATGTPVITTNWRAIPEIVENNVTGYLVKPGDVMDLVNKLQAINGDDYKRLCHAAYEKYDMFNCEIIYNDYLNKMKETI